MRLLQRSPSVYGIGLSIVLGAASPSLAAELGALDAPAHIAFVDGNVLLEREGQSQSATSGLPFLPGDRIRSTAGRIEILFPDGSALHVDDGSSVELLSATLLRMTAGRILLIVAGATDPTNAISYQIDTPVASAVTDGPGEYRVSVLSDSFSPDVELAVLRGWATFSTDVGSVPMSAGERSLAHDGAAPSLPRAFNSARFDAFDTWSLARRDARMSRAASADYLPSDMRMYGGTLDQYGTWQYETPHGYVWYPAVSPDWRPYYHGYWTSYPSFGWTWIGMDVWAWPTHHYGRWGYARSRWYWVPGRTWGAAWVHWATAPDFIGWSPLGFDNRPVFGVSITIGDPRWVVVPRRAFGVRNAYVHEQVVARHQFSQDARFVVQSAAPTFPARGAARTVEEAPARRVAIPRAQQPGRAVPRRAEGIAPAAPLQRDLPSASVSTSADERVLERARQAIRTRPPAVTPHLPALSSSHGVRSRTGVEPAAEPAVGAPVESVVGGVGGSEQRPRSVRRDGGPSQRPAQVGATPPAQVSGPAAGGQLAQRRSVPAVREPAPAASGRVAQRRSMPAVREPAPAAAPSRAERTASAPGPEAAPQAGGRRAPAGGSTVGRRSR